MYKYVLESNIMIGKNLFRKGVRTHKRNYNNSLNKTRENKLVKQLKDIENLELNRSLEINTEEI